jgi:hypothetical protein
MVAKGLLLTVAAAASLAARADVPGRAEPVYYEVPQTAQAAPDPSADVVYMCPMDPEIRSHNPGTCRRCGMTLVSGVPDPVEFHVDVDPIPAVPIPGQPSVLQFSIHDPWKEKPVDLFNVVHERLFHAFVVSEDLQFFDHAHPALVGNGIFQAPVRFPRAGMYRVLSDFYPVGATPQLSTQTILVPGDSPVSHTPLAKDYSPKHDRNMTVEMESIPQLAVAGNRTQLRFTIDDPVGLQQYLGVWGHLLAVSEDLIDMMHEHPSRTDEGGIVDFDVVFPREGIYRIWVQFQKQNLVNTVRFDVPVVHLD